MEPQYTMVRKLINPYSIFVVADYYGFDAACTVLFSSLAILMFFLPVVNEFIWFTAADLPDITKFDLETYDLRGAHQNLDVCSHYYPYIMQLLHQDLHPV
ncbi:hypothetical protein L1987_87944 [Smallanthus sonchifolius]|nr:hypothetical protein L1987_87944 [Smallanthus sonchifolius]